MSLRAIVPIDLAKAPRVTPAAIAQQPKPQLRWAVPAELLVEEVYQRGLGAKSIALIRRIVAAWDWSRMKPPICAELPGGKLAVIDGQHTAIAAASHGGIAKIPVMVVPCIDLAARAAAFVGHNRDRLGLTPYAVHRAEVAAGEATALRIEQACRQAGARIVGPQAQFRVGDTMAVQFVRQLVVAGGIGAAARVLKLLVAAGRAPLAALELKAASVLLGGGRVAESALPRLVKSRAREDWERAAAARGKLERKQLWRALADLWRAQLEGHSSQQRSPAALPGGDRASGNGRGAPSLEGRGTGEDCGSRAHEAGVTRGSRTPYTGQAAESVRELSGGRVANGVAAPLPAGGRPAPLAQERELLENAPAARSPIRSSAPPTIVRNERIERDVLDAIERGPAAGVDLGTLRVKTAWPENNIRIALAALAHEKRIARRGQRYVLKGIEE